MIVRGRRVGLVNGEGACYVYTKYGQNENDV